MNTSALEPASLEGDLGLGFVPVGTQTVRVLASPDRRQKPDVETLREALSDAPKFASSLAGITGPET